MTLLRLALAAGAVGLAIPVLLVLAATLVLGAPPPQSTDPTSSPVGSEVADIPADYLQLYVATGERYGLDWAVIAAIGKIETDHGRSNLPGVKSGVNTHGCCGGPMQFWISPPHPNTWDRYGLDANNDGRRDPHDPADAIPSAGRYLRVSGAPGDWRRAIFAYNHAGWYVDQVLAQAERYRQAADQPAPDAGTAEDTPAGVERIIEIATAIGRRRIPYCYGGGHVTPAKPTTAPGSYCRASNGMKVSGSLYRGLDCSSSVSMLLQLAGYRLPTMTSGEFARWGEPGPGRHVTIWANAGHVFITVNGRGWGTSSQNHSSGPGWAEHRTAGFVARHPPGL